MNDSRFSSVLLGTVVLSLLLAPVPAIGNQETNPTLDQKESSKVENWRKEANLLNRRGLEFFGAGRYAEAAEAFRQTLILREKIYPKSKYPRGHADIAESLNNLAYVHRERGEIAQAEPLYERALEMYGQVLGKKHPHYANSLNNLATIHQTLGNFAKAEALFKQAAEIYRDALGEKHAHYAASLNNLALLYFLEGEYAKAEPLYQKAAEIRKAASGANHPDYAGTLVNLAELYKAQGDDAKAEPLHQKALEIIREALGENHPNYAASLDNLATFHSSRGNFAQAEPLFQKALEIRRKVLGENHPLYALTLNNLALLCQFQGDEARAEAFYEQALKIHRQALGAKHPDYATILNNLARLHREQKNFAKAEPLYKQALEIRRQVLGEKHPDFAASVNSLAIHYLDRRDFAQAEPLFKQALEIRRLALGEKHPDFAASLNDLAVMFQTQGEFAKAEPLFKQALEIDRRRLGEKHPRFAVALNNLALFYFAREEFAKAEPLSRQSVLIMRDLLEQTALVQSERQQLVHQEKAEEWFGNFIHITANLPSSASSTYDVALSWKGSVTARQRLGRMARTPLANDPHSKRLFDEMELLARQIKLWSRKNPDKLPKGFDLSNKMADLSEQREVVEAKLSARTEAFRKLRASRKLTGAELQKLLPDGTALVDFVVAGEELAAFVVTRDRLDRVELGKIKPLAEAVDGFRRTLKRTTPLQGKNDPALVIREKLLDPLDKHLAGAKLVLIAPDGPLNQLPFAALPGKKQGSYLLEEIALAIIPVPQMLPELLASPAATAKSTSRLLVLGDVDFDAVPAKSDQSSTDSGILTLAAERTGRAFKWNRLPGTAVEMEMIEKLFRKTGSDGLVTSLRANDATEERFRSKVPGHDFLHLATHGFFAPKEIKKLHVKAGPHGLDRDNVRVLGHHPGLLSGLVMAGANRAEEGKGDGVLTALEVGELDLTRVRLAVLSACETGLGETAGGEGVLGLQRAFQVAGAKSVVATLWSIPDEATQVMMGRFYDNLWSKKTSRLEALREAQLWLLREGRRHPQVQRGATRDDLPEDAQNGRLPPHYWAAFVLSGDWR